MSNTRKDFAAWRPQGVRPQGLCFYALWDVDATADYARDWPQRPLGVYHRQLLKQEAWFAIRTASGHGYVNFRDGRRHELESGSFFAFPMADLWSYGSAGEDWVFRWYDFSGDPEWPAEPRLLVGDPAEGLLSDTLQRLTRSAGEASGRAAAGCFEALVGLWKLSLESASDGDATRQRVQAQIDRIRGLPGATWKLPAMAKGCSLSETRLRELYQEICGEGPREFLLRCRMEEAARRLTFSRVEVARIAAELGYGHAAHFTRAFKAWHGRGPRQFRQGRN
ncbi:MAG: hypothetical protein RL095_3703 [Verrucomicrobiota bacterium]|jgi:AraC-like DNA-binding protein